jgi:glycosyltransferase involved in cell wall biosynthesis
MKATTMRLAVINETWPAGSTRCATDLARGLAARHHVRYYPRDGKETASGLLADLHAYQPQAVSVHSFYGDLPYAFLAQVARSYPTVYTPHDVRPAGVMDPTCYSCAESAFCCRCPLASRPARASVFLNPYLLRRLRKRIVHLLAPRSMILAPPSQWLLSRLARHELGRFRGRVIYNGIDTDRFRPVAGARATLGLPPNVPILLHVASGDAGWRMHPFKGLPDLADAFVQVVLPRLPDALLLVAGERVVPNHPSVRPMGTVAFDDLPLLYSAADVYVLATLADTFPYTVIEAMGCARAVVASRVCGVSEQVVDGETGLLVPPGDPVALADAILGVVQTPGRAAAMGDAGRARATTLFAMDRFVKAHEDALTEAAGAGTTQGAC